MYRNASIVTLFCMLAAVGRAAAPTLAPLEHYANLPYVQSVALSPDGSRVAIVHNVDGNSLLLVRRPEEEEFVVLLRGDNENGNIRWVRWANSDYVLVSAAYAARRGATNTMETRLLSIPAHGGEPRSLLRDKEEDRWGRGDKGSHVPQFQDRIVDMLQGDPQHILVAWDLEERDSPGVYRVDVTNSRRKLVHPYRDGFDEWLTDRQHRVRVGVARQEGEVTIHVRGVDGGDFKPYWRYPVFSRDTVEPLGFGLDPEELYVRAYHDGHLAVFKVHLAQPESRELVLVLPDQDIDGELFHSQQSGEAVGLVDAGGRMRMWAPWYVGFVAALEKAFPTVAVSLAGMSDDGQRYLLFNLGGDDPGTFYFGNRQTGQVAPIAFRYPALSAGAVVGNSPVRFTARDDTLLQGRLTVPAGARHENLPAIIFPGGTPSAMSQRGFDYWGEFFANRGYAVLQVEFRAATDYGADPLRAGLQGWRRGMEHDVVDAARWLVAQGVADPARMCVVGASYGGYAALMSAITAPKLFRCVVSFAGVTDLVDLVAYAHRFENSEMLESVVGDDSSELRRYSPLTLVKQLNTPLLLVHGAEDRLVRVHHGRAMARAMQRAGKSHIYVEQAAGDHYLSSQAQRLQLFREMERFLATHLGAGSG